MLTDQCYQPAPTVFSLNPELGRTLPNGYVPSVGRVATGHCPRAPTVPSGAVGLTVASRRDQPQRRGRFRLTVAVPRTGRRDGGSTLLSRPMTTAHASEPRRIPTAWVAGSVLGIALLFAGGCATAQSPVRSPASPSGGSSNAATRATHASGTLGAPSATSSSASGASAASGTPHAGTNSRSSGVKSGANPGSYSAGGTARTGSTATHQAQPSAAPLSAGGKWIISATQLRVASGPTLLSFPTAPLTFSVEGGTAALSSGGRTIAAAVDVYPYSARGSAATVALTRAAFTLDLLRADAGAGNPPVIAWNLPYLSATIAEGTSALLRLQLSVPAGVPGGQYALALANTLVKAAVAGHSTTVAPPDWQYNTSATAQVSLPSRPGTT